MTITFFCKLYCWYITTCNWNITTFNHNCLWKSPVFHAFHASAGWQKATECDFTILKHTKICWFQILLALNEFKVYIENKYYNLK